MNNNHGCIWISRHSRCSQLCRDELITSQCQTVHSLLLNIVICAYFPYPCHWIRSWSWFWAETFASRLRVFETELDCSWDPRPWSCDLKTDNRSSCLTRAILLSSTYLRGEQPGKNSQRRGRVRFDPVRIPDVTKVPGTSMRFHKPGYVWYILQGRSSCKV